MDKELKRSLNKIKKLFNKMQYNNISPNEKRNIAIDTYDTYAGQVQAILREANTHFGIEKIEDLSLDIFKKLIEKRVENFLDGEFSESNNINSKLTAFKAFLIGMDKTNVYRKTKRTSEVSKIGYKDDIEIGTKDDIKEIRKFVGESGVLRKGSDSTVLRAKPDQVMAVVDNVRKNGYNTINRATAADIALLSLASGARVSSCLKMRARDIDFDNKCITMKNAKGGLTYYVDINDNDIPFLKSLVGDLQPNQKIFELRRRDGTLLSGEESRKIVHRYIKEAGVDFYEVEKREITQKNGTKIEVDHTKNFAFHSIRKAYALKIMGLYIDKIKSQKDIIKEVERISKRDPKILDKYQKLINRSNYYRVEKNKKIVRENKERLKLKLPKSPLLPLKTEVSIKSAVTFFTSIQLGHFRNDIVTNYYCTFEEAIKNKR